MASILHLIIGLCALLQQSLLPGKTTGTIWIMPDSTEISQKSRHQRDFIFEVTSHHSSSVWLAHPWTCLGSLLRICSFLPTHSKPELFFARQSPLVPHEDPALPPAHPPAAGALPSTLSQGTLFRPQCCSHSQGSARRAAQPIRTSMKFTLLEGGGRISPPQSAPAKCFKAPSKAGFGQHHWNQKPNGTKPS